MDPLSYVIWRATFYVSVVVLLLTGFWNTAHASQPPAYYVFISGCGITNPPQSTQYSSWDAAGTAWQPICSAQYPGWYMIYDPAPSCPTDNSGGIIDCYFTGNRYNNPQGTGGSFGGVNVRIAATCPSGSSPDGSAPPNGCSGTAIPPVTCPSAGTAAGSYTTAAGGAYVSGFGVPAGGGQTGECDVTCSPMGGTYTLAGHPFTTVSCSYSGTGSTGSPAPSTPAPANGNPDPTAGVTPVSPQEAPCISSGGTWGTVNGAGTCLAAGTPGDPVNYTGPGVSSTTTTPIPSGAPTDPGGTSTTTTTTTPTVTCDQNGNCTTTTTGNNYTVTCPAGTTAPTTAKAGSVPSGCTGAQSGTSTTTAPGGGGAGGCQAGQQCDSFGGSCASGFTFGGDALLGAIAVEDYQINCKLYAPSNQLGSDADSQAYLGGLAGDQTSAGASSPVRSALKGNATSVDASTVQWDTAGFWGGGSCPNFDFTAMGATAIHVDVTDFCTGVAGLGLLLVAGTAVGCFLIYARVLGGA